MFDVTLEGEAEFLAEAKAFEDDLRTDAREAVFAAVKAGQAVALAAPFGNRTGALRERLYANLVEVTPENVDGEIWASQPYASFVENGTPPHDIRPRTASVLAWADSGGKHFSRFVHHPGTKSIPFMGPAYLKAEAVLTARMEEAGVHAAARFK